MQRRALALAAVLTAGACEDLSYRDIGVQINVLTKRDDALVPPAEKKLVSFGVRALPQIETALHTAPLSGRLRLIRVLETVGDPEAIPVLRHFAVYDADKEVRTACDTILQRWAKTPGDRGSRAQAALTRVAEKRAKGEGPLTRTDGGR